MPANPDSKSDLCAPLDPSVKEHGSAVVLAINAAEHLVILERQQARGTLSPVSPTPKAYRSWALKDPLLAGKADLVDKAAQEIRDGRRPMNRYVAPLRYIQADGSLAGTPRPSGGLQN